MLEKNRRYYVFSLVLALFTTSSYLAYITSPELSTYFGYDDLNTIFQKQLISVFIGISIILLLCSLDSDIWLNRIGLSIFIVSLLLLLLMLVVPTSIVPVVDEKKIYLHIAGLTINPILFFIIGALWLISWVHSVKKDLYFTNITIFILIFTTAFLCTAFRDILTLLLFEILFLTMLVYINGINRLTVITLTGILVVSISYILRAPEYQIDRINSWLESSSAYTPTLSIENALHENILLTLVNNLGIVPFIFIMLLYLGISYLAFIHTYKNPSHKIFAVGVAFLLVLDLIFNILYTFGLSPLYPPTMYLLGYGNSVIIASSIMMGMILMLMKIDKRK